MKVNELYRVSALVAIMQLSFLINKAIYGQQASLITRQGKPALCLFPVSSGGPFSNPGKQQNYAHRMPRL